MKNGVIVACLSLLMALSLLYPRHYCLASDLKKGNLKKGEGIDIDFCKIKLPGCHNAESWPLNMGSVKERFGRYLGDYGESGPIYFECDIRIYEDNTKGEYIYDESGSVSSITLRREDWDRRIPIDEPIDYGRNENLVGMHIEFCRHDNCYNNLNRNMAAQVIYVYRNSISKRILFDKYWNILSINLPYDGYISIFFRDEFGIGGKNIPYPNSQSKEEYKHVGTKEKINFCEIGLPKCENPNSWPVNISEAVNSILLQEYDGPNRLAALPDGSEMKVYYGEDGSIGTVIRTHLKKTVEELWSIQAGPWPENFPHDIRI